MIIAGAEDNKAEIGVENAQIGKFRIKESAKAFSILSSSLYKNPIQAIIRELSCNARDSHKESGQTKKWAIHCPTSMEPYFSVQDFGLGLDHDSVMRIYTTYFESTKSGSNDFVGGLGLGSKSPFSYTTNFTVTAIKDGKMNLYSAFLNDEACPSIVLMSSSDTTLGNGVEVKFGVKAADFGRFQVEIRTVVYAFPIDEWPEPTGIALYESESVKSRMLYMKEVGEHVLNTPYSSVSSVLMGGVMYPIDAGNIAFQKQESILGAKFLFEVGIGDVDIQPSREALTYTTKTIDYIKGRIDKIQAYVRKDLLVKTSVAKNLHDKILSARDACEKYGSLNNMFFEQFLKSVNVQRPKISTKLPPGIKIRTLERGRSGGWKRSLSKQRDIWFCWPDSDDFFIINDKKLPMNFLTKSLDPTTQRIVIVEVDNILKKPTDAVTWFKDNLFGHEISIASVIHPNASPAKLKVPKSDVVYRPKSAQYGYSAQSEKFSMCRGIDSKPASGDFYFDLDDEAFPVDENGKRISVDFQLHLTNYIRNGGSSASGAITSAKFWGFKKDYAGDKNMMKNVFVVVAEMVKEIYLKFGSYASHTVQGAMRGEAQALILQPKASRIKDPEIVKYLNEIVTVSNYNKSTGPKLTSALIHHFLTKAENDSFKEANTIAANIDKKYPFLEDLSSGAHSYIDELIWYINEKFKLQPTA